MHEINPFKLSVLQDVAHGLAVSNEVTLHKPTTLLLPDRFSDWLLLRFITTLLLPEGGKLQHFQSVRAEPEVILVVTLT